MKIELRDGLAFMREVEEPVITDVQAVLDLLATVGYEFDVAKLVLPKEAFVEDFFRLSSGLAGDVTQKFVNYGFQIAIVGDFSHYNSKPLHDYMYECNHGRHLFFVSDEEAAVEKLRR